MIGNSFWQKQSKSSPVHFENNFGVITLTIPRFLIDVERQNARAAAAVGESGPPPANFESVGSVSGLLVEAKEGGSGCVDEGHSTKVASSSNLDHVLLRHSELLAPLFDLPLLPEFDSMR